MSQPLDRERPLWETWLVEGLEGGHWALVFKVHHCMVDGIAGVGLLTVLLDLEADTALGEPEPWAPRTRASRRAEGARRVERACVKHSLGRPRLPASHHGSDHRGLDPCAQTRKAPSVSYEHLVPTRPSSIEGSIGPHRVWAHSSASLEDVKTIRSAFGGTVNDVVLAAVAGGYRELLLKRGTTLTGLSSARSCRCRPGTTTDTGCLTTGFPRSSTSSRSIFPTQWSASGPCTIR